MAAARMLKEGVWISAIILAALAGWFDWRYRRIPNWLNILGVLAGIAMNTFLYQGLPGLGFALKGLFLAFAVYVVLYALHAMGAGDVKLMAAVGSMTASLLIVPSASVGCLRNPWRAIIALRKAK